MGHVKLVLVWIVGFSIGYGICQSAMGHTQATLYLYGAAATGIVTYVSWFPNPNAAMDFLYIKICEEWGCEKKEIICKSFNAV